MEAFFLPVAHAQGSRFCVHWPPAAQAQPRGVVLYLPPFAEEMNKSRRMVAMQSRAMAELGYAVLSIDLHGCGDSSGELAEASWQGWIDDALAAVRWLDAHHPAQPLWLWGLRSGALLAGAVAARIDRPSSLLLWQPVLAGKQVLQQFLRLQAAADLIEGKQQGATAVLKQQLAQGQAVDVAGYRLPPAVASGLEAATLQPPPGACQVLWMEVSSRAEPVLTPASGLALDKWRAAGVAVQGAAVRGPAFWQTVEIEDAPALIEATLAALQAAEAPAAPAAPEAGSAGAAEQQAPHGTPYLESATVFGCGGEQLLGVLTRPAAPPATALPGVLVVVGGPQYRVGAHRQFVELARALAAAGHVVLRFDVRGMGDSSGALHDFLRTDDDIAAAIDTLCRESGVQQVVLWGLCDGASAALLYCDSRADPRVVGLALANPWVRSQESLAATHVKHYYLRRVLDRAFWRKLAAGGIGRRAAGELAGNLATALRGRLMRTRRASAAGPLPYQERMARGWRGFAGPLLLVVSGDDYTAREFIDATGSAPAWRGALAREGLQRLDLPQADHTFSDRRYGAQVASATTAWLAATSGTGATAAAHRSTHP